MDWISGLQRAIDYIEENLTEELDYEEIAGRAYCSSFHFQRVFGILCGCSLGEYIRNRRLSTAGSELTSSDIRVIDVAMKYGYDSPESFGRAFTRFHGISPSQAKQEGANLKSYSRLSVKLTLNGGSIMDYRIEKKPAFRVIGKKERFPNDTELASKLVPEFWERCQNDGTINKLCSYYEKDNVLGNVLLGICYEGDANKKDYPYSIAIASEKGILSEGLTDDIIPAHTWAIFKCMGALPAAIQELWKRIYAEFFPAGEYKQCGGLDMEVYPDGDMNSPKYVTEIWIPVQKK
jgi:AraC family transcriptional regulator